MRTHQWNSLMKRNAPKVAPTLLALLCVSAASKGADQWYPSKYGAQDTIGAANNMSAEIVRDAGKLIRTGKVYELGIDIGTPSASSKRPFGHRTYSITVVPVREERIVGHDDVIHMWMGGFGSSMDGLGHLG